MRPQPHALGLMWAVRRTLRPEGAIVLHGSKVYLNASLCYKIHVEMNLDEDRLRLDPVYLSGTLPKMRTSSQTFLLGVYTVGIVHEVELVATKTLNCSPWHGVPRRYPIGLDPYFQHIPGGIVLKVSEL